jgi:oxygen-independent coproporphyrinogen-3 oxidase
MTQVTSLYLHVPYCKHLCNYCDFYKLALDKVTHPFESFHQFLIESWEQHQNLMQEHKVEWGPLHSLYLGGGTPSLWGEAGADFIQSWLMPKVSLASDCEFTMEVDPGTWSAQSLKKWRDLGLNRISIGTQTLNEQFLKIMDRSHSLEESLLLLSYCQQEHINFSMDFLLGIPFSQKYSRNILEELKRLLDFEPKHISLYILNARSKYPFLTAIPDDEYIREEYLRVSDYLIEQGFEHYEVSNFAKPGLASKHNLKYWQAASVAALGPTGTGYFQISSELAMRYKWKVTSAKYELEPLGIQELLMEEMYLGLRTELGWQPRKMSQGLSDIFARWEAAGLGCFVSPRMQLNSRGFIMLDSLVDELFKAGADIPLMFSIV